MKLYSVTVRSIRSLSYYTLKERCQGQQRYWWLKGPAGFVDIGEHRADKPICLGMELPAGRYVLGCGPDEPRGIRERFTVGRSGARRSTYYPNIYNRLHLK